MKTPWYNNDKIFKYVISGLIFLLLIEAAILVAGEMFVRGLL